MTGYYNLGAYERPISTSNSDAALWFNRGLNWCYAFHHEEALRCFDRAIEADPDCAMGYWGRAYAVGPYYNIPWAKMSPSGRVHALAYTHENANKALQLVNAGDTTPLEKALCRALSVRFQAPAVEDPDVLVSWDDAYA
ncbi:MAG: tetratricopeptide repeat protein, partial [Gammaproteobacteria bacterium]